MFKHGVICLILGRRVCPIIPVFFSEVVFFFRDLLEIVSWQRAARVAVHLASVGLCLHIVTVILGKETVERSQPGTGENTKALGTEGTCNSFDLLLQTVYLLSSSLLQRLPCLTLPNALPFMFLCLFHLFSCFRDTRLPLQHPTPCQIYHCIC